MSFKLKTLTKFMCFTVLSGLIATNAMAKTDSTKIRGYVNKFDQLDLLNKTFTNDFGFTVPLESMHMVVKDLDRPSEEIAATCNMPIGAEWSPKNMLKYSKKYEHAFRVFIYVNTDQELEENLVAVFIVSPGRYGVHVEKSGTRNFGSYTTAGEWNVLDHKSSILAGEKIGQASNGTSIFDLYLSKASEGAPMYNAIFFQRGTAFHGSNGKVDGNPRSHACVRMRTGESPLAQQLANAVGGNVKVSIRDTEVFKHCYDREFVRQEIDRENFLEESKRNMEISPRVREALLLGNGGLY